MEPRASQAVMTLELGRMLDGRRRWKMLETLAVVLVVLWLLGLVSSYTMGGLIHVLLVLAAVVMLVSVLLGRKALW
jgi:hypothetical protein